jgi:hypothetical protein
VCVSREPCRRCSRRCAATLLAATLNQPEKWWYLSELAQLLKTTPSSLQRELKALVARCSRIRGGRDRPAVDWSSTRSSKHGSMRSPRICGGEKRRDYGRVSPNYLYAGHGANHLSDAGIFSYHHRDISSEHAKRICAVVCAD